jgi:putative colanic acid biosynthesis acetyltransferase WcaF
MQDERPAFRRYKQENRNDSPWSVRVRFAMVFWEFCWVLFCLWTPKPFNAWRLSWLRLFGAKVHGCPFVHQRARIAIPWNITLHDRACIGDRANLYSLAEIEINALAVIAQEAYLCTGSHDFGVDEFPLITAKIVIGERAFVGARAFVLAGVTIGRRSVVGACSVVTRSVADGVTVMGNPAVPRKRLGQFGCGNPTLTDASEPSISK